MLDISIPELRKEEKKLDAVKFLNDTNLKIVEKFDGTKLTLVRNNLPRSSDYAENWIVSYKGNILFPEEFVYVTQEMLPQSIGVSQYKRVFDHLRSIPKDVDVESGLELFVEFVQNKPTLTRDYEKFGDMYLIGYSTCEHVTLGLRTYTTSENLLTTRNAELSSLLRLKLPPVLYTGALSSRFSSIRDVINAYSCFDSSLGGKAEGVVINHGGRVFKVVSPDQYDKAVRKAKKMRFALDEPGETAYWSKVKEYANELVKRYWTFDIRKMLKCLSYEVYADSDFKFSDLRSLNSKKNDVMLRDDLMLTAKLLYEEERELRGTRIGVIPMAGRPVHAGHWRLIKNALAESDTVYLFVSVKGRGECQERIEPGQMMKAWKDVLLPRLDSQVVVRFVENPVLDANRFVKDASRVSDRLFTFYGDDADVNDRWNKKNLETLFPALVRENRVFAKGLSREKTVNISSTQMRKWIASCDIESLRKFLPDIPGEDSKTYLRILLSSQKR